MLVISTLPPWIIISTFPPFLAENWQTNGPAIPTTIIVGSALFNYSIAVTSRKSPGGGGTLLRSISTTTSTEGARLRPSKKQKKKNFKQSQNNNPKHSLISEEADELSGGQQNCVEESCGSFLAGPDDKTHNFDVIKIEYVKHRPQILGFVEENFGIRYSFGLALPLILGSWLTVGALSHAGRKA